MPGPYHSANQFAEESVEIYEGWMHRLNKERNITTEEYERLAAKYWQDHLDRLEKAGVVFTKTGFEFRKDQDNERK